MKAAPVSASWVDDMMVSMTLHVMRIESLVGGEGDFSLTGYLGVLLRKKIPCARKRALGSLRYDASEWTQSFILLVMNLILASG